MNEVREKEELFLKGLEAYHEGNYFDAHEFWENLWIEIESWDTGNLKPNEEKVLEAIKLLLAHPDSIEIFNKKAIYLYLRELTGLNTKQVVNNLNKLRVKYRSFKSDWNEGKITHIEDRNDVKKEESKP